jgi:hypothetical protein
VLDPLLAAGRFISTSPLELPVTVLLGDALLTGTQVVALADALPAAPAFMLDVVLGLLAPVVAVSVLRVVDGVVPVPLAPLVVFRPVKR